MEPTTLQNALRELGGGSGNYLIFHKGGRDTKLMTAQQPKATGGKHDNPRASPVRALPMNAPLDTAYSLLVHSSYSTTWICDLGMLAYDPRSHVAPWVPAGFVLVISNIKSKECKPT